MSRRMRSAHLSEDQTRPLFEWLECRQLLAFLVAAVDPRPGARLAAAPTALIVTFNQPIEPFSPSMSDILLGRVADDGSLSWLDDAIQDLGPEEDQLLLTPGQELAPGRYRLSLRNESGLMSTGGEVLEPDDTGEEFRTLGDFWIEQEGPVLDDAIDLDTPGSIPTSVGGTLDFGANPRDVKLYKFTLPAGHFWRLGLEVTSQRDGGTLDSALVLFDADGRPVASSDAGRPDAPYDPYLFTGLEPGTYYVGVSGTGDLPGTSRGYDPVAGTPGSVVQAQAGGPFTLHLVADPADAPITLLDMDVNRHDSKDSTPTGFTLQFSGAIRVYSLSRGVEVVDQAGRTWPIEASDYLESEARISFLFRDRLPEGQYVVRLPGQGGLVDLAGLTPVAPGLPPSVMGTFSVDPRPAKEDPRDLGALLPGPGAVVGVSGRASLPPDTSVSYRVVITFAHLYSFQTRYVGGPLAIVRTGPDGTVLMDPGDPDLWSARNQIFLAPGEYLFGLSAAGSQSVDVEFILKGPFNIGDDLTLANGVGQGPALSLRLIAPERNPLEPLPPGPTPLPEGPFRPPVTPPLLLPEGPFRPPVTPPLPLPEGPFRPPVTPPLPLIPYQPPTPPAPTSPPGPFVGPMPTQPDQGGADTTPDSSRPSPIPGVGAVGNLPASTVSVLGLVGDLVGRPSPEGQPAEEVDPGREPGVTASATEVFGLLQQFGDERMSRHRFGPGVVPRLDDPLPPGTDVDPSRPVPVKEVSMSNLSRGDSQGPISDGTDLPRRLGSFIGSWAEAWLSGSHHDDGGDVGPSAPARIAADETGSSREPLRQSSLVSPAPLGSATAIGLAMLLIPRSRRWLKRWRSGQARKLGPTTRPGSPASTGRGGGPP